MKGVAAVAVTGAGVAEHYAHAAPANPAPAQPGASVTLAPGNMNVVTVQASLAAGGGTLTLVAPGTITNVSTSNSALAPVAPQGGSVQLQVEIEVAGTYPSGVTVNWTDATGTPQTTNVPVTVVVS